MIANVKQIRQNYYCDRPLIDENGYDLMPNTLTEVSMQVGLFTFTSFLRYSFLLKYFIKQA